DEYSPQFLLQLPFLQECCFTNVRFYCPPPHNDDERNYCYYYPLRRLMLAIYPLRQLKILDLSHIQNNDYFKIDSWGQENPHQLIPLINFSLEQLYLPEPDGSRMDFTSIREWLKRFPNPYTITKRSNCILLSKF